MGAQGFRDSDWSPATTEHIQFLQCDKHYTGTVNPKKTKLSKFQIQKHFCQISGK